MASDTYESGELLLNFMWPKLSKGGIICVCDYGSYPNALPLTVYVDNFKTIEDEALHIDLKLWNIFYENKKSINF